jgi:hypothetical protein
MAAILVMSVCGGGATRLPSPTGPLVATRVPTPVPPPSSVSYAFFAELKSSNQVPPIKDAEAACTGQGRFVLLARLDPAGKVTAAGAEFSFFVNSCPTSTRITLTHIHQAPAGENGAIKIDSGLKGPVELRNGELGFHVADIGVADFALLAEIIANPAGYYFDVHSVLHPAGLLRGQLSPET